MKKDYKGATENTSKISMLPTATVTPSVTVRDRERHDLRQKRDFEGHREEFVVVAASTGEEVARYVSDGRRMPKPGDWVQLYQQFAEQLAVDPSGSLESRCVWLVVARAGFGNLVRINLSEVAREWGASRETLSRAMTCLVQRGVIERAKGGSFRLNPNFVWKGDAKLRLPMRARWHRDRDNAEAVESVEDGGLA